MDVPTHQAPKETQSPLAKTAAATTKFKRTNEISQVKSIKKGAIEPKGALVNSIKEDAMPKYGIKVDREEEVDKVIWGLFCLDITHPLWRILYE